MFFASLFRPSILHIFSGFFTLRAYPPTRLHAPAIFAPPPNFRDAIRSFLLIGSPHPTPHPGGVQRDRRRDYTLRYSTDTVQIRYSYSIVQKLRIYSVNELVCCVGATRAAGARKFFFLELKCCFLGKSGVNRKKIESL